jgi:hypothetical protein
MLDLRVPPLMFVIRVDVLSLRQPLNTCERVVVRSISMFEDIIFPINKRTVTNMCRKIEHTRLHFPMMTIRIFIAESSLSIPVDL